MKIFGCASFTQENRYVKKLQESGAILDSKRTNRRDVLSDQSWIKLVRLETLPSISLACFGQQMNVSV
jgi:hypothetical protein